MLNPDPYEGWPDQDMEIQEEEVLVLGPVKIDIKMEKERMKKMLRRMKRSKRCHKKNPNNKGNEHSRNKGDSPFCGNKLDNSPSTLKRLCNACFQVVGKRATSIHEPP